MIKDWQEVFLVVIGFLVLVVFVCVMVLTYWVQRQAKNVDDTVWGLVED